MAQVTKVHGDFKPVFNADERSYTQSGINAVESGKVVNPAGPKLDFFTIEADGHLSGADLKRVFDITTLLSRVHIYEVDTSGSDDLINVALYPTGAWTAATLLTALDTDAGIAIDAVTAGATFSA